MQSPQPHRRRETQTRALQDVLNRRTTLWTRAVTFQATQVIAAPRALSIAQEPAFVVKRANDAVATRDSVRLPWCVCHEPHHFTRSSERAPAFAPDQHIVHGGRPRQDHSVRLGKTANSCALRSGRVAALSRLDQPREQPFNSQDE
jgi:hypothetical protein